MMDIEFDLDIEAEISQEKKDLNTVLPKLAKRLLSSQHKMDDVIQPTTGPSLTSPPGRRRPTRRSVNGSICYNPGTIPSELDSLRAQDIQPDADSAADRALQAANQFVAEENVTDAAGRQRMVEGREIQQGHAQYALTYGMMLGIRVATGRRDRRSTVEQRGSSTTTEEYELSDADFDDNTRLTFPPQGSFGRPLNPFPTPPHKLKFSFYFKDYMPAVFRAVRALCGIDEADYMLSLAGDFNYIEFLANSKSGQFFFYSHCGRFMIKTMSRDEAKLLLKMFKSYVNHLATVPDSLLVRFLGLHKVQMVGLQKSTFFCIMRSVFDTTRTLSVKYDLKGSTVGRKTEDNNAVLKDLNLLESGRRLCFGEGNIDIFRETLIADVFFLRDLGIMDYSLLVGVYEKSETQEQPQRSTSRRRSSGVTLAKGAIAALEALNASKAAMTTGSTSSSPGSPLPPPADAASNYNNSSGKSPQVRFTTDSSLQSPQQQQQSQLSQAVSIFQSYDGGLLSPNPTPPNTEEIYYLGIIDVLQKYNTSKRMENFVKGFSYKRSELSAVDPALYADRMVQFIMNITDYSEVMERRKVAQRSAVGASIERVKVKQQQKPQPQGNGRR